MMKKFALTIILTLFATVFVTASAQKTYAYTITERAAYHLDEKLADTSTTSYLLPKKILVAQITTDARDLEQDSEVWMQSLYYYSITRQNFADIPYNYVVDRDGVVYRGHAGYDGVVPELQTPEGAILIGYLSNSTDVPAAAQKSMTELIAALSSKYGISRASTKPVVLSVAPKASADSQELAKLKYADATGTYLSSMLSLFSQTAFSTVAQAQTYTGEIKNLVVPTELKASTTGTVTFVVTNKDTFPWFTNSRFLYVSTANGKKSAMAVNGKWDSFVKPTHFSDKVILPGDEVTVTFDVQAGFIPTAASKENFKLIIEPNVKIAGSDFSVTFKITKGDFDLIQVVPKNYDYINIRVCPAFNCGSVGQAVKGEILPTTGIQNGWYKVKTSDGKDGWVFGQYMKKLNY